MQFIVLVVPQEHRKHEETRKARKQRHSDGPPQMTCPAPSVQDASCISECNELIKLPNPDGSDYNYSCNRP